MDIGGSSLKWISNSGKFRRLRIHFLHSITHHHQMETLLSMVIRDKKFDNYKLFTGQEEKKRILQDIRYNLDDIVVRLCTIECYVFLESNTRSNEHLEVLTIIKNLAPVSPNDSFATSLITILD